MIAYPARLRRIARDHQLVRANSRPTQRADRAATAFLLSKLYRPHIITHLLPDSLPEHDGQKPRRHLRKAGHSNTTILEIDKVRVQPIAGTNSGPKHLIRRQPPRRHPVKSADPIGASPTSERARPAPARMELFRKSSLVHASNIAFFALFTISLPANSICVRISVT